jgi:alkanesulfonate monooxygenase SsuD/methylene tetrahydromethanopterin reductase-like flavin-dependent oxidoreductase (luciferase family)
MVGANASRMLSITLPHVDAWNTWFTPYGNTVEGFASHNAGIDAAAERAGRDPREIWRSACVLTEVGRGGERPRDIPAVPVARLPDHLRALGEAGADEAILVVDPISEESIRELGARLRAVPR